MWTQAFSESIYIFSIDCETYKTMNTRNTSTMPFLALGIHSVLRLTVIKYNYYNGNIPGCLLTQVSLENQCEE